MRKLMLLALACAVGAASAACSQSGTLAAATEALGAANLQSIEYSGTGRWYQFGQAPGPTLPWPQFDVSSFTATVDYGTPGARLQMVRRQTIEPGRERPAPAEQRPIQIVSGTSAWNMAVPAGSPPDAEPAPQPQPAAVEERTMEIWTTPHGFLKAAAANNATSTPADGGSEVTFATADGHRYAGRINAQNQVERVQTWIDNTVLGDTPVEFTYSEYRDFGGVMFPGRIMRTQGGHPVLDITVSEVTANPSLALDVPEAVRTFTPPAVEVTVDRLANGVYHLRGGSHHSLAIDQADHIVVVEGPQNEARSMAVIAKVKETIPNKPIRYLVNTHVHFDHSGGLRTYVDEGATVVTHEANQTFYEQAWGAPRTLMADMLSKSGKTATFETVSGMHELSDGRRTIQIHEIAGSGHNDAFLMVYLPAEGILFESDAYTPAPANAPPPAMPNPYSMNLHDNIQRLKLNVRQIAAGHGPRVATMADLRAAIGLGTRGTN
ncbi:MAG: MBL fold metallo-hydrolase [Acidobacteria bacterium]|nr:MBL fold metallo-hydrolase [Acidobacteriota bacterium]